jgi:hypothetical protein
VKSNFLDFTRYAATNKIEPVAFSPLRAGGVPGLFPAPPTPPHPSGPPGVAVAPLLSSSR